VGEGQISVPQQPITGMGGSPPAPGGPRLRVSDGRSRVREGFVALFCPGAQRRCLGALR